MAKYVILIFISFGIYSALAADFFVIDQALPETIKSLKPFTDLPENKIEYKTDKGVIAKCYAGKQILILSHNEFGQGYELRETIPTNVQCLKLANREFKNAAGIQLLMDKNKVLNLLKAPQASDNSTLIYNQKKVIKHKNYDEQTWVDVEFSQNKLSRLSVFVSLTQ